MYYIYRKKAGQLQLNAVFLTLFQAKSYCIKEMNQILYLKAKKFAMNPKHTARALDNHVLERVVVTKMKKYVIATRGNKVKVGIYTIGGSKSKTPEFEITKYENRKMKIK